MAVKNIIVFCAIFCGFTIAVQAGPSRFYRNSENHNGNNSTDGETQAENLRLTFENEDDIPSAFIDTPAQRNENVMRAIPSNQESRKSSYTTCKDGSGGVCVDAGQCPSHLKAEKPSLTACKTSQECCFGVPESDTSCSNRGGECVPTSSCGNAPKLRGTECSEVNGQVCCVFL